MYDLQDYAQALTAYEQALQLDPHYAAVYYGKGRVYEMPGLLAEAQEAFAQATSLRFSAS